MTNTIKGKELEKIRAITLESGAAYERSTQPVMDQGDDWAGIKAALIVAAVAFAAMGLAAYVMTATGWAR